MRNEYFRQHKKRILNILCSFVCLFLFLKKLLYIFLLKQHTALQNNSYSVNKIVFIFFLTLVMIRFSCSLKKQRED